jgi:hypothetical protein
MTKEKMIEIFESLGLNDEQMMKFHKLFESKYPADHQAFLEWLNIPSPEIAAIRKKSQ